MQRILGLRGGDDERQEPDAERPLEPETGEFRRHERVEGLEQGAACQEVHTTAPELAGAGAGQDELLPGAGFEQFVDHVQQVGHPLVELEVWPPYECPRDPTDAIAKEVGIDRAKAVTQADGPDGSSYCGDPVTVRESLSPHAVKIYEVELTCVRETYPEAHDDTEDAEGEAPPSEAEPVTAAEGKKGPTYFAEISSSWKKRVLLADPVGNDPRKQSTKEESNLALVREILGTLKTFPTQKPPGICIEELQHRGFSIGIPPR